MCASLEMIARKSVENLEYNNTASRIEMMNTRGSQEDIGTAASEEMSAKMFIHAPHSKEEGSPDKQTSQADTSLEPSLITFGNKNNTI